MLLYVFNYVRRRLISSGLLIAALGFVLVFYQSTPKNTFSPGCAYHFAYHLNVTIEVDGKPYSSRVISQVLKPRDWVRGFGGSCREPIGSIVPFRLDDKRLVLLWSDICSKALKAFGGTNYYHPSDNFVPAMREHRKINIASLCVGLRRDQREQARIFDGFVVDNADSPARWRGFTFESNNTAEHVRIISAVAEADNTSPEDGLEKIAPEILRTDFEHKDWAMSPEVMFGYRSPYISRHVAHTAAEEQP